MTHRTTPQRSNAFSAGPVALLLIGMTSVQIGAVLAKGMFAAVGPLGAVALRVSFSATLLTAVFRPWRVRRSPEAWRSVLLYGAALGGMNAFFYVALKTVPLGIATALEFTGPLAVAILSSRRTVDFLWVALAVAGLAALVPSAAGASVDPVGAGFALAGGVCWALYIVFGRKAGAEHGLETAAVGMAVAAVIVVPVGLAGAGPALLTSHIIGLLPTALAVAVLSSALPYTIEMYALPRMPAKTFGTLMSMEPAIGALAGLTLLSEQLTGRQWLGMVAIIATSVGTTLTAAQVGSPVADVVDPAPEAPESEAMAA
jgi:inner membrane transporter RhtA